MRIKYIKGQIEIAKQPMLSPQEIVMKVIWPLENLVMRKSISIHLLSKIHEGFDIIGDQSIYELVLFNLVQNATKFNKTTLGHVVITLEIKALKDSAARGN
jgi:signal transduction histidine kinase